MSCFRYAYCLQDESTYFGLRFSTHFGLEVRGQFGTKNHKIGNIHKDFELY